MRVQRVYLDTSVLGGCFDAEFAPWSNQLLNDFRQQRLYPVLSTLVAAELQDAPPAVQAVYQELMTLGAELLTVTEPAIELASAYQRHGILTAKFYTDGLHIGVATVADVDVVVSWNFKHIVHFEKIRLFNAVNLEYGYKPLYIHSPREVTYYGTTDNQGR